MHDPIAIRRLAVFGLRRKWSKSVVAVVVVTWPDDDAKAAAAAAARAIPARISPAMEDAKKALLLPLFWNWT